MESPYNRPIACNLIDQVIGEWAKTLEDSLLSGNLICGWSVEMQIYDALRRAGYLTEEAMMLVDDDIQPTPEPSQFCCDRTSKWDPCK